MSFSYPHFPGSGSGLYNFCQCRHPPALFVFGDSIFHTNGIIRAPLPCLKTFTWLSADCRIKSRCFCRHSGSWSLNPALLHCLLPQLCTYTHMHTHMSACSLPYLYGVTCRAQTPGSKPDPPCSAPGEALCFRILQRCPDAEEEVCDSPLHP